MKTKNIILIFLLITIVFSCNKPKEPTPIEPIPEAPKLPVLDSITREFALFKPNSWWVYESDSIIHIINPSLGYYDIPDSVDSFKVFLDTITVIQIDTGGTAYYTDIKLIDTTITDTLINNWLTVDFSSNLYHKTKKYAMEKRNYYYYNYLYYVKNDPVFFRGKAYGNSYNNSEFYFNSSLSTDSLPGQYEEPTENGYFVEELDSMTVRGKTYYNIRHFIDISSGHNQNYWHHFYWAKNIGLIKYKTDAGELPYFGSVWWELVDYNAEQ